MSPDRTQRMPGLRSDKSPRGLSPEPEPSGRSRSCIHRLKSRVLTLFQRGRPAVLTNGDVDAIASLSLLAEEGLISRVELEELKQRLRESPSG